MKVPSFKIRTKLSLGIGALLTLILLLGAISYFSNKHTNESYQEMQEDKTILFLIKSIEQQITSYTAGERGYLLNSDPAYLDAMQSKSEALQANFTNLKNLPNLEDNDRQALSDMEGKLTVFFNDSQTLIALHKQGQQAEAMEMHVGIAQKHQADLEAQIVSFTQKLDGELKADQEELNIEKQQFEIFLVSVVTISVALGLIFGFLLLRSILRPIRLVHRQLTDIADGEGDLTKEIILNSQDEIGDMSRSFNRMLGNLRTIIAEVRSTAEQVVASSEELNANSEQATQATEQIVTTMQELNAGSDHQVGTVQETNATMQEISHSIERITLNAKQVTDSANHVSQQANEGNQEIKIAVQQMQTISSTIHKLEQAIQALSTRSEEIGQIVEVITGIAGQTNLLALNAAIEASRAGTVGRGFAVVADEIRILADQSNQSAQRIAALISTIQDHTHHAVQSMERGSKEVVIGLDIVNKAGVTFQQIQQSVDQVAVQIHEVSTATQQISGGVTHVVDSMTGVSEVAVTTSAASQKVSASTQQQLASMEDINLATIELTKIAEHLLLMVSKFKA